MQSLRKLLPRRVAVESRSALASSRALLAGPRFWTSTAARVDGSPKPQVHLVCLTSPLVPYSAPLQWMLDLVAAKARKVDPEPKDYLFIVQHAYVCGGASAMLRVGAHGLHCLYPSPPMPPPALNFPSIPDPSPRARLLRCTGRSTRWASARATSTSSSTWARGVRTRCTFWNAGVKSLTTVPVS